MSNQLTKSFNGIARYQITVAKNNEIWLYSDEFCSQLSATVMQLVSDVPDVVNMNQTTVEIAYLALSEKPI